MYFCFTYQTGGQRCFESCWVGFCRPRHTVGFPLLIYVPISGDGTCSLPNGRICCTVFSETQSKLCQSYLASSQTNILANRTGTGQIGQQKNVGRNVGRKQESIDSICQKRLTDRLTSILADETHPLKPEFDSRLIDRSGRLRAPVARTSRFRQSFVPRAIHAFNQSHERKNLISA